jgi:hypothetical protein
VPIASRKEEESLSFPDRYECTYLPSPREIPPVESAEGVVQERCWALDMRVRYPPSVMTWVEEGIYVLRSKERTPVSADTLSFCSKNESNPLSKPFMISFPGSGKFLFHGIGIV